MTDEEINITIAEHCGWTRIQKWDDYWLGTPPHSNDHIIIPDYCNDLNAMHEAEKLLPPLLWNDYANKLIHYWDSGGTRYAGYIRADARQRAEALFNVIGKWDETTIEGDTK